MDDTPKLVSVIAGQVMRAAVDFLRGDPAIDVDRLAALLREETVAGYPDLLAEMKEADAAFYGNHAMLNTVLSVGCAAIASKAVKRYKELVPA